jgi:iron-sulfur cluster assembly accessory protein
MEMTITAPVTFTQKAIAEIKRLLQEESVGKEKFLKVAVKGGGCSGLSYVLGIDERQAADEVYEYNGISYLMNPAHGIYLTGMEVDWEDGLNARGFTFKNPNASKSCGCGTSFAV